MTNSPWLDEVLRRLAKRRLPADYVQRLAEELLDHLEDLKEETMSTDANLYSRLGKPEQVADAAVTAYRRRTFLGRHPMAALLVFGLSPIASLVVMTLLAGVTLAMGCVMLGYYDFIDKLWLLDHSGNVAWTVATLVTIVIPSTLASMFYCELGNSLGIHRKWMFVSCAVLAAIAAAPWWRATPGNSGTLYSLVLDFGLCSPFQLGQFLVPFLVAWWFVRRKHGRSYPLIASLIFIVSPVVALLVLMQLACFGLEVVALNIPATQVAVNINSPLAIGSTTHAVLPYVAPIVVVVIPSVFLGVVYGAFARWLGMGTRWMIVSCVVLAVLGGSLCICHPIPDASGRGNLWSGIGFHSPMQLFQFVAPLAVGWWLVRRHPRRIAGPTPCLLGEPQGSAWQ